MLELFNAAACFNPAAATGQALLNTPFIKKLSGLAD